MRIIYCTSICFGIITFFCHGMEKEEYIAVITSDLGSVAVRKADIKKSLVLDVLYAHQKKNSPYTIVIPAAVHKNEDITAKDVTTLNHLLQKKDAEAYLVKKKSYSKIVRYAQVTHLLGAYQHFFHIIDSFFTSDIKNNIGNHMMTNDVQEYLIKKIIKKRKTIEPQEINESDCWVSSSLNGECYYIPFEILKYKTLSYSGKNPFIIEVFVKNEGNVPLKAISKNKQYSIVQKGGNEDQELLLINAKHNFTYTLVKKSNNFCNQGNIKHVLFSENE